MACRGRMLKVAVLLAAVGLGAVGSPAAGQGKAPGRPAGPVAGTVVDPAGEPVAGAEVWLVGGNSGESPITLAKTTSDAQGRFLFAAVREASEALLRRPGVIARDGQGRIGSGPYLWPHRGQPPRTAIQVKLHNVKECRGRLVDTSGKPIAGASIQLKHWSWSPPGRGDPVSLEFPAVLMKELESRTAADGSFVVRGVPGQGQVRVVLRAPGYGPLRASWNLEKPAALEVPPTGSVHLSVTGVKDAGALAGIEFMLVCTRDLAERQERDCDVYYLHQGLTLTDGALRFDQVPAGKCILRLSVSEKLPYYLDSPVRFGLKPGESAKVAIALQPAIVLKGRIVDRQTGAGVPGVSVRVSIDQADAPLWDRQTTTDAQGAYQVHGRPGKAVVDLENVPAQYLSPGRVSTGYPTRFLEAEVAKDTVLPPIELERLHALSGVVVDESGKAVANAEIRYTDFDQLRALDDIVRSDADGKFSVGGLTTKPVSIRARTDKAAGDPVTVRPAEAKGPIRLVVSDASASAIRGTIVDDAGRPVRGAQISLATFWSYGGGAIGFRLATMASDAEGRFKVGGLWPGDEYYVLVSAGGYDQGASPPVQGRRGQTHDFGNLLLKRIGAVVEGTVVDSSGKPIADVRVFNWGNAAEPLETRTDASGRYRLKGFHAGAVYVFAEKEGYRFTRLHTASGTTGAVLKMRRRDEPLPPQPSRAAPVSQEEEQKLARRLLERVWASGSQGKVERTVLIMARIDLDQARKWSAETGGKYDGVIRQIVAEKTAEKDLDEAIGLLAREEGPMGFLLLKRLADRFATSHPDKAQRLAEEAVLRARGMDLPGKISCMAEVVPLIARLGHEDAARKLISEAADLAEKMQDSDSNSYVRGRVAAALASYDFPRALSLANKIGNPNDRDGYRAVVAAAGGIGDVDRALAALEGLKPSFADRARLRLAYRLAATRPADAARIIESMPSSSAFGFQRETKAQMLRWMAAGTAPRDKAEAWKMVDMAFELYLSPSEGQYSDNRRATQAAALAVVAQQIGYPDMESVVSRVIATRVTTKHASSPAAVVDSAVAMAMLLALVDPEAARQVLTPLEPQSDLVGLGSSGVGHDAWLKAWALADPKHAMEVADRELAKLAKARDRRDGDLSRSGLFEMVELWTLPANERFPRLAPYPHNLAFPDEEF